VTLGLLTDEPAGKKGAKKTAKASQSDAAQVQDSGSEKKPAAKKAPAKKSSSPSSK